MAIRRLHEGFGIGQDSCVSGRHPMTEQDVLNGTEGVYLGDNPESPATGLFLTYWDAEEVAQTIGYPPITVYEEQRRLIDEQALEIAELEHRLDSEVHNLQLKAVSTEIKNIKKEVLHEIEGLTDAIRARISSGGSDAKPTARAAKAPGGAATL